MLCLKSAKKKLTFLFWDLLLPVWNGNLTSHKTVPVSAMAVDRLCPSSSLTNPWQHNVFASCKGLEEHSVQGSGDENEVKEQRG